MSVVFSESVAVYFKNQVELCLFVSKTQTHLHPVVLYNDLRFDLLSVESVLFLLFKSMLSESNRQE